MSNEALKTALLGAIEMFKEKPDAAKAVFRAETALVKDVECTAKIRDFDSFTVDEPPELGGTDKAANPVELVLAALGTCQEIMYAAYASVMGITLTKCEVNVKGYLDLKGLFGMDENIPSGYTSIQFQTTLESPNSSEEMKQLVATVESHCPVLDTLQRPIDVKGEVTANGEKIH